MDDLNRSISVYVKSGQYYTDARNWYANKFIFLISQRSYIIFILSFFVVALSILGFYYQATNPAMPHITYVSSSPNIATSYSVIFPAGVDTDNPQLQVSKYMVANYVRKRQAYDFGNVKNQLNFVRNTTVGTEYLRYEQMMSINNPSSPLMLYQDVNVIDIKIMDIKIVSHVGNQWQSLVYFKSSLRNLASNHIDSKKMVAIVKFKIDNIEKLLVNDAKKLMFLVVEYNLQKVNES